MRPPPSKTDNEALLTGAESLAGYGSIQPSGPSSGNASINNDSSPGHSSNPEETANINGRAFLDALVQAKPIRSISNPEDDSNAVDNLLTLVHKTPINFNVKGSDGLTAMDHICLTSDKFFLDILIKKEVNLKNGGPLNRLLEFCAAIVKSDKTEARVTSALDKLQMSQDILTKVQSSWTAADYCTCASMLQKLVDSGKKNSYFKPVSDAAGKILIDVKNTMVEKIFNSLELYLKKSDRDPLNNPYSIDLQEVISPRDIYNYMIKKSLQISDPQQRFDFLDTQLKSGFETFFKDCDEGGPQILKEIKTKLEMMGSQLHKIAHSPETKANHGPN